MGTALVTSWAINAPIFVRNALEAARGYSRAVRRGAIACRLGDDGDGGRWIDRRRRRCYAQAVQTCAKSNALWRAPARHVRRRHSHADLCDPTLRVGKEVGRGMASFSARAARDGMVEVAALSRPRFSSRSRLRPLVGTESAPGPIDQRVG